MWDTRHFTALQASTACYGDNFYFYIFILARRVTMSQAKNRFFSRSAEFKICSSETICTSSAYCSFCTHENAACSCNSSARQQEMGSGLRLTEPEQKLFVSVTVPVWQQWKGKVSVLPGHIRLSSLWCDTYVTYGYGNYPGSEQCSLLWVLACE
jgi:hypothetical protein